MRFLDLDLDFFLSRNAYSSGRDGARLSSTYKPWSVSKTRHFLEDRCALSSDAPVLGRIIESHDGILDFWHTLIESNKLKVPFEVIHIDAHPDLWICGGMYLESEFLYVDLSRVLAIMEKKRVHSGNYLTFAIVYGWIGSLVWISLRKPLKDLPRWDGNARSGLLQSIWPKSESSPIPDLPMGRRQYVVPFKTLPWHKYRTREPFDYIALSRSPNFTPCESERLVTIVKGYMEQI